MTLFQRASPSAGCVRRAKLGQICVTQETEFRRKDAIGTVTRFIQLFGARTQHGAHTQQPRSFTSPSVYSQWPPWRTKRLRSCKRTAQPATR